MALGGSEPFVESGERRKAAAEAEAEAEAAAAEVEGGEIDGWSSAFQARSSHSITSPRSRQGSGSPTARDSPFGSSFSKNASRFSISRSSLPPSPSPSASWAFRSLSAWRIWPHCRFYWTRSGTAVTKQQQRGRRRAVTRVWQRKRVRGLIAIVGLVGFYFFTNWWMLSRLQDDEHLDDGLFLDGTSPSSSLSSSSRGEWNKWSESVKGRRPWRVMYSRLLALAAHALAEGASKPEPQDLWKEPLLPASSWTPCADQISWDACEGENGYILVSANGGINQQRVAVCNAVVVARLLNATLVLPNFLYNSVWRDESQFGDIYKEEHFVNYLKADIRIVKKLPMELQSLDLEAIGSVVTDAEIMKEAKPSFYLKNILPILLRNRVVHFLGFGNRLAFDPIPFQLQRLRCRCNFHALHFVPKIQKTGALLVQRMRPKIMRSGLVERNLLGPFAVELNGKAKLGIPKDGSQYLALHLRFEIDMAAHSMCEFGGGEEERKELDAYRAIHFPALTLLKESNKLPSAASLRLEGKCPLTPEETVLMLAALGFNRKTHIYVAGADIYGGMSRMAALISLYPNLVTKEKLLSPSEIEPFLNFSSQLAALDFIVCAAADVFAITDSGSQLSSLVSGYRIYYGGGRMPTIRPNKRRLAGLFIKNATIEWVELEERVRKSVRETKQIHERPVARSIYRYPRCPECMCRMD